jgi:aminoglycoside phosphotransferase (APT) family kinase protein
MFLKLSDRLAKAAAAHPEELRHLLDLLGKMEEVADRRRPVEPVQGHGQFRPIHVFLGAGGVTVIDLDRSGPGDPARDVAEFIHRLRSALGRDGGAGPHADALTTVFLREYADRAPGRLGNLPFYHGFQVLVSLCRHMKRLDPDDPARPAMLDFYARELEAVTSGRLLESAGPI